MYDRGSEEFADQRNFLQHKANSQGEEQNAQGIQETGGNILEERILNDMGKHGPVGDHVQQINAKGVGGNQTYQGEVFFPVQRENIHKDYNAEGEYRIKAVPDCIKVKFQKTGIEDTHQTKTKTRKT